MADEPIVFEGIAQVLGRGFWAAPDPRDVEVTLTELELAEALRAGAKGAYRDEAAVQLLADHGTWLRRDDFQETLIGEPDAGMAWVDWGGVAAFLESVPWSSSEGSVLRIAAALTGHLLVDLGDELTSLDATNMRYVLNAVAHCNGLHERGVKVVVDGWPSGD